MAFELKEWTAVPWSEVEQDEVVRTADGREWIVRGAWNGQRVLLHPWPVGYAAGVPVAPALTDGTKTVEALRHRPDPTPADPWTGEVAVPRFGTPDWRPPAMVPVPADEPASTRRATIDGSEPLPDVERPKFGQPSGSAEEDDEGRAVAALARGGLAPELVSVEEAGKVLVPRELDDLALRSHLFLMHGHLDDEQDVDRKKLSDLHRTMHESECPHAHVNRSELPA